MKNKTHISLYMLYLGMFTLYSVYIILTHSELSKKKGKFLFQTKD